MVCGFDVDIEFYFLICMFKKFKKIVLLRYGFYVIFNWIKGILMVFWRDGYFLFLR